MAVDLNGKIDIHAERLIGLNGRLCVFSHQSRSWCHPCRCSSTRSRQRLVPRTQQPGQSRPADGSRGHPGLCRRTTRSPHHQGPHPQVPSSGPSAPGAYPPAREHLPAQRRTAVSDRTRSRPPGCHTCIDEHVRSSPRECLACVSLAVVSGGVATGTRCVR